MGSDDDGVELLLDALPVDETDWTPILGSTMITKTFEVC